MEHNVIGKPRRIVAITASVALMGSFIHAQCALAAVHATPASVRMAVPTHAAVSLQIEAPALKGYGPSQQIGVGKLVRPSQQDGGGKKPAPLLQQDGGGKKPAPLLQQDGGGKKPAPLFQQDGGGV